MTTKQIIRLQIIISIVVFVLMMIVGIASLL